MTLHLDWFGLTEGLATDLRGMPTLVGFHPPAIFVSTFPASIAPFLLCVAEEERDSEDALATGAPLGIRLEILAPDGTAMFLTQQQVIVAPKAIAELPTRISAVAHAPLQVTKPGWYEARIEIAHSAGEVLLHAERRFYVMETPSSGSSNSSDAVDKPPSDSDSET